MNGRWAVLLIAAVAGMAASLAGRPAVQASTSPLVSPGQLKEFVVTTTGRRHDYEITHGGTIDGENSRYPMGVGAPPQAFESNLSVTLENVGDTDVVNPWLSNHRTAFRSSADLVASVIQPGMSDEEKALALFHKALSLRFHGDAYEEEDVPMRVFNVYGFNTCGGASAVLMQLWRHAGLESRMNMMPYHVVPEVRYDGAWHVLDGDLGAQYLLRDNRTTASFMQLAGDHELIRRGHSYGILEPERGNSLNTAPLYSLWRLFSAERGRHLSHDDLHALYWIKSVDRTLRYQTVSLDDSAEMAMRLRPGERISYSWEPMATDQILGARFTREHAIRLVTRGEWSYRPDLADPRWRAGATTAAGVREGAGGLVADGPDAGEVVWRLRSPYPFFEIRLEAVGTGVTWQASWAKDQWVAVKPGVIARPASLRDTPTRDVFVRARLAAGASLRSLQLSAAFQAARIALPGMRLGLNRFTVRQDGEGSLRVTHTWSERDANRPPSPPVPGSVAPAAHDQTGLAFTWSPASDEDGDAITDYQFQLSAHADMRWPLTPTFDRLTSRMGALEGSATSIVFKRDGLLRPGVDYFWRVRARDGVGLWGAWSDPATFRIDAPAPPVAELAFDSGSRTGILKWRPGAYGAFPASYEVHGAHRPGFSVTPQTLLATTATTHLQVLGPESANKAFFRVVAIGANGRRSAPSERVTAPRPFIYSTPVTRASSGTPYSYRAASITSRGIRGKYDGKGTERWDGDQIVWSLEKGPSWLTVDKQGVLRGTPKGPGRHPVALRAFSNRAGADTQSFEIVVDGAARLVPDGRDDRRPASCGADVTPVVRRFFDLLAGAGTPQELRALIHERFVVRIDRAKYGEAFVLAALADLQARHREFGPVSALRIFPITCEPHRADVIVVLDYSDGRNVVRDRMTLTRHANTWLIGRPR